MGTKFFHPAVPMNHGINPTSGSGAESALAKSIGYQGRGAGNAAGKDLAAAKVLGGSAGPLAPVKKSAATGAPGPKRT